MKKLSRTWAQISIVCAAASVVGIVGGWAVDSPELMTGGFLCLLASYAIKAAVFRCPRCGWWGGIPKWTKGSSIRCPKCGMPMEYDR